MSVSIACEIQETKDVPLSVNGQIPYWSSYRSAYDWLDKLGYNKGGKIGVVYESSKDIAIRRFGNRLVASREVVK